MNLLAIDLGTTGVRAVCYDTERGQTRRAYRSLGASYPQPGWLEQDPQELFSQALAVANEAVSQQPVAALGIACQRGTAIAWDRCTGKALAPAIGWQDQRTLPRVKELIAQGIGVNTLAACSKFEWLVQEVPAVAAAANRGTLALGTPDAWLNFCLSGGTVLATDTSNAGATGLLDNASGEWLDLAMELFHQDPAWHMRVVPADEICGATNLLAGAAEVPLAGRAGDQQAACFAHHLKPGEGKLSLGTSAMLDVHTGSVLREAPAGAYALPLWALTREAPQFCLEGSVVTAGAAVEWLKRIGLLDRVADFSRTTWDITAKPLFLPALQGLGTPHVAEDVRGAFINLTLDSNKKSLLQAVLSGLAHRCCDVLKALQPELSAIYVDGGLSQSNAMCQAIADLTGTVVKQSSEPDMTALGAARLAGRGLGRELSADTTSEDFSLLASSDYQEYHSAVSETSVRRARERWAEGIAMFHSSETPASRSS